MDQSVTFVEEIDFGEIQLLEVVGKGSFGVVRKGIWHSRNVAVKMIETEAEKKAFIVEVRQLSRVSHPNIVKLYGACTGSDVCLVMEYAEGGSLYNVLHGDPQPEYSAAHAFHWALQCAIGVAYLHGMKPKALIHRDLKPPNLLLVAGGTVLKICDFGTACDARTHMTNSKGSAAWMAPEVFEGQVYTETCDVFSWGIILWEVITRRKPFDEIGGPAFRIMWAVHKGQRPPLICGCPRLFEMLMTGCWDKDPRRRPTMDEVVRVMSKELRYFHGWNEPIRYPPQSDSESGTLDSLSTSSDTSHLQGAGTDATVSEGPTAKVAGKVVDVVTTAVEVQTVSQKRLSVDLSQLVSQETPKTGHGHQRTRSYGSSFVPADRDLSTDSGMGQSGDSGNATKMPSTKSASIQSLYPVDKPLATPKPDNRPVPQIPNMGHDAQQTHLLESAYLLLDPRFQPIPPCLRSPESVRIFEEHKQMAHEFLLMQTEMTHLNQRMSHQASQLNYDNPGVAAEKFGRVNSKLIDELVELQSERVSLEQLHESLKQQLAVIRAQQRKNYAPRGRGRIQQR